VVLAAGHLPMALSCLIQRGAFFLALMAASVLRVMRAALAHSHRMKRMALLPWRVRLDLRLPALSLLPGLSAAQQARRSGEPKRAMSSPISMRISAAAIWSMPGMVCSRL